MKNISRRNFLSKSAMGLGSAMLISRFPLSHGISELPKTVKIPIGFQTWIVRENLGKDFQGTLKTVAQLGYQSLEMCSPPGYKDLGFGPLMKYSAKEMKKIINDSEMIWESSHYGMDELRLSLNERIKFAQESGQKQMIVSSFGLPEDAKLTDWLKCADEMNKMGVVVKNAGLRLGYHNHHMEFKELEGKLIYDELMKTLDKEYVGMQFQVAVISVGYKAVDYFRKYPGRFISAHLADWSKETNKQVAIGQGVVDWKEFFANLKLAGVQNIFVEMDFSTFKDSINYLKNL
ncbi:MAG TPA: sugar phosphate isomerase/epimerase [Bacteroidales bacterium]|nr:sugar phosphate isomerase/epimerase [Bacteroidales bacterium]